MIHRLVHALSPIPGVSPSARGGFPCAEPGSTVVAKDAQACVPLSSLPASPASHSRESSEAARRLQVSRSYYASHCHKSDNIWTIFTNSQKSWQCVPFCLALLCASRRVELRGFEGSKVCTRCTTAQVSRWYYTSLCQSFDKKNYQRAIVRMTLVKYTLKEDQSEVESKFKLTLHWWYHLISTSIQWLILKNTC